MLRDEIIRISEGKVVKSKFGRAKTVYEILPNQKGLSEYWIMPSSTVNWWNLSSTLIEQMKQEKVNFSLVFISEKNDEVFYIDYDEVELFLQDISTCKDRGDYKVNRRDLVNPITIDSFIEFIVNL